MSTVVPLFLAGGGGPPLAPVPPPPVSSVVSKADKAWARIEPKPCEYCRQSWKPRVRGHRFCSRACASSANAAARVGHPGTKLNAAIVAEMRLAFEGGMPVASIAEVYGVSYWTTRDVCHGRTWRAA